MREELVRKVTNSMTSSQNPYCKMSYLELLHTPSWLSLRQRILARDGYKCKICQRAETLKKWDVHTNSFAWFSVHLPDKCRKYRNSFICNGITHFFYIFDERSFLFQKERCPVSLQIHHRYYMVGILPWEYDYECYETLCMDCHFELHKKEQVPVFIRSGGKWVKWPKLSVCSRCNGAGFLPRFNHVEGGICFRCWGARFEEFITPW